MEYFFNSGTSDSNALIGPIGGAQDAIRHFVIDPTLMALVLMLVNPINRSQIAN